MAERSANSCFRNLPLVFEEIPDEFVLGTYTIADEDANASSINFRNSANLGEIIVTLWRMNVGRESSPSNGQHELKNGLGPVSEKMLKGRALSHTTK